jgi:hypothetical protein
MSTVDEIVGAAARLDAAQFLQLRQKLDDLEKELWEAEFAKTAAEMEQANVTDETIDRLVMRRRYEGRR